MKKILCSLLLATSLSLIPCWGQSAPKAESSVSAQPQLTKFSIDFPGGSPKQLVAALQKAMGRQLNVIIPVSIVEVSLPPMKVENVDIQQLFNAINSFGKMDIRPSHSIGGRFVNGAAIRFSFISNGTPSDDTVWTFLSQLEGQPPAQETRFFPLSSYIDAGISVDDITTAIQTGWKMRGEGSVAKLSFHKETKLLIAYGYQEDLFLIDDVLRALSPLVAKASATVPAKGPSLEGDRKN